MAVYLTPPPQNPLARLLAGIVAILVLTGAFLIGFVVFIAVAGIALIAGAWIWFRSWRLRRQAGAAAGDAGFSDVMKDAARSKEGSERGATIEAEYTVIKSEDRR